MIFQLVAHQPQALGTIVRHTPHWVWGLLAALLALGASQLAPRRASPLRVCLVPVSLTIFAIYGLVAAFGGSGQEAGAAGAWLGATIGSLALSLWRFPAPLAGTRFDPATNTFALPGSVLPLLLIAGIFLTKYIVGIELALQPSQAQSAPFVLTVALLYGAFNGLFVARLARLWRLTRVHPSRFATPQTLKL
ncbi:MAG: hypothetical protein H6930_04985 [Rhodoferax sp.]|nr:hypothetical protein [Rhodoferax sp.]